MRRILAVIAVSAVAATSALSFAPAASAATTPSTIYVSACNASTPIATVTSGSVGGPAVTSIDWTSSSDSLTIVNNCSTGGSSLSIGVQSLASDGTGGSTYVANGATGTLPGLGADVSQILIKEITAVGPPTVYGATLKTIAATSPAGPSITNNNDGTATIVFTSPQTLYLCPTSVTPGSCGMMSATYSISMMGKTSPYTLRVGDAAKDGMGMTTTTVAAGTYNMNLGGNPSGKQAPNVLIGTAPTPSSARPDAPNAPFAVAGIGSASVSVTAALTGGTPTSFTVTSSPDAKTCTVTVPATSCEVSGLTNGKAYTFSATATNADGTSDASAASNSVTPDKAPNGPAMAPQYAKASSIAHPGVSVLLKKAVVTQSGVTATPRVRFVEYVQGLRPRGDVAPSTKLGTYTVTKSGKVIANVLSSQPMTIILTLRAPATSTFKAYKSVKTWVLK